MDLATLLGLLSGIGVMLGAIMLGPSAGLFVNVSGLLIVIGGTFAAVMMKFSLGQFLGAVKVAIRAFLHKAVPIDSLIKKLDTLSNKARKEGFMALEGAKLGDPFMEKGAQLLADGHPPEVVRDVLAKEIERTAHRHQGGQKIFKAIGDVAPAMGMIGTLIGLIQMLANMEDPQSIGPAMAVALLTTLYGAMIANLVALPIADKLALRSREEVERKQLILDGFKGIQAGHNPRLVKEVLVTYLPGSQQKAVKSAA